MNKTKIEWCDMTFNPVTGCYYGCEYCYARRIAERFKGEYSFESLMHEQQTEFPYVIAEKSKSPYPCGFTPTFHPHKLNEPQQVKKPQNIFVCSMADLFGEWMPDEWIERVFQACEQASWHRYLFLTKNPAKYRDLYNRKAFPYSENYWFGSTVTRPSEEFVWFGDTPYKSFVSIEPMLEPFGNFEGDGLPNWVIVGAETGNRKGKAVPQRSWIEEIVKECDANGIPVFMKDSLIPIVGEAAMRREFPWDVEVQNG